MKKEPDQQEEKIMKQKMAWAGCMFCIILSVIFTAGCSKKAAKQEQYFRADAELNVRDQAGTDGGIIYTAQEKELLEMTGEEKKDASSAIWYEVITPNTIKGWVNSADGAARTDVFYITPSGKRYHDDRECAGKNATPIVTEEIPEKYTPCQTCLSELLNK